MTSSRSDRRKATGGIRHGLAALLLLAMTLPCPAQARDDEALIQRTADLINTIRNRLDACDDQGMLAASPVADRATPAPSRPRLAWNPLLAETARRHSASMASEHYFDHVDRQGRTVGARARAAGYRYRVVGENLAAGHVSIDEAVGGWLLSPSHCRNLIDARFTEFGIAQVPSSDPTDPYRTYWTLVLGLPQTAQQLAAAR